jgi:hypothetical protein
MLSVVLLGTVFRYLKDVKHRKLTWCTGKVRYSLKRGELSSYSDSSWSDDKPSHKSTYSYFLFCNNTVFSWKSTLAPILAFSTSETELITGCACAQEVLFCRKLANELGFLQIAPTLLFEDNHGAICLSHWKNIVSFLRKEHSFTIIEFVIFPTSGQTCTPPVVYL